MRRMRENNLEVKEVVRYESNEIKKDKVNDEKSTEINKTSKECMMIYLQMITLR